MTAEHQIGRLQVAVDHTLVVGVRHGIADLEEMLQALRQQMRLVGRLIVFEAGARFLDQLGEGLAFDQPHRVSGFATGGKF